MGVIPHFLFVCETVCYLISQQKSLLVFADDDRKIGDFSIIISKNQRKERIFDEYLGNIRFSKYSSKNEEKVFPFFQKFGMNHTFDVSRFGIVSFLAARIQK